MFDCVFRAEYMNDKSIRGLLFNNYSNEGAQAQGGHGQSRVVSRGEDNIVIRTGAEPVPCSVYTGNTTSAPPPHRPGGSISGSMRGAFLDDPLEWWLAQAEAR